MIAISDAFLRGQLEERRQALDAVIGQGAESAELVRLLEQVDTALGRMDKGTFGLCATCHDSIEKDRLIADPLLCFCLDHLSNEQQRALEEDLELASRIQRGLLPSQNLRFPGWKVHYHYQPAGPVSGDYCDLIQPVNGGGKLFFFLGDVSGKGVAASMLMSHLHAMFRSLTTVGMPLEQMMELANRVFCESTTAGQYATLVCGRAGRTGELEICNAGHPASLLLRKGEVTQIESTGLPLGMFSTGSYPVTRTTLEPGDTLFLYTDGLSEARDRSGAEFGVARVSQFVSERHALAPEALTAACLENLKHHAAGAARTDDLTIMVLRRGA